MRFFSSGKGERHLGSNNGKIDASLAERLVTLRDPSSVGSEAYRSLRTNLLYSFVDNPPKAIVFTSSGVAEGKSTVCSNLAVVLAQASKSTLILDCDLRKPSVHRFFGMRNARGIVEVLAGAHPLEEVWAEPIKDLKVVTVGPVPPNPTELLGSQRFSQLITEVRREFDYVLIDSSPVGLVSDAAIIAVKGDGVMFVIDAQKTRKSAVRDSVHSLETVGANVIGTVLNNSKDAGGGYYNYPYG